jgi:hypothetical protein
MRKHRLRDWLAVSLAVAALSAVGCVDVSTEAERDPLDDVVTEAAALQVPLDAGVPSGANVKFEVVGTAGSGCPAGTWHLESVPEGNAFTVTFDRFALETPPTVTAITSEAFCSLSIKVVTPKGLSYAVSSFQFYGYANMRAAMSGSLLVSYAFQGFGIRDTQKVLRHDFTPPLDETYAVNDEVVARGIPLSFAPCDITTNLQVRVRLVLQSSNPDAPGILTMDNLDGRAEAAVGVSLETRPCPRRE